MIECNMFIGGMGAGKTKKQNEYLTKKYSNLDRLVISILTSEKAIQFYTGHDFNDYKEWKILKSRSDETIPENSICHAIDLEKDSITLNKDTKVVIIDDLLYLDKIVNFFADKQTIEKMYMDEKLEQEILQDMYSKKTMDEIHSIDFDYYRDPLYERLRNKKDEEFREHLIKKIMNIIYSFPNLECIIITSNPSYAFDRKPVKFIKELESYVKTFISNLVFNKERLYLKCDKCHEVEYHIKDCQCTHIYSTKGCKGVYTQYRKINKDYNPEYELCELDDNKYINLCYNYSKICKQD